MRYYEPIWIALKNKKQISITANRAIHPRIIKAVIKEKWMDVGYKINIEPRRSILTYNSRGSVLTFYLSFTHSSITVEDL